MEKLHWEKSLQDLVSASLSSPCLFSTSPQAAITQAPPFLGLFPTYVPFYMAFPFSRMSSLPLFTRRTLSYLRLTQASPFCDTFPIFPSLPPPFYLFPEGSCLRTLCSHNAVWSGGATSLSSFIFVLFSFSMISTVLDMEWKVNKYWERRKGESEGRKQMTDKR